jgi:nicotinate-nucleotide pyrophosphorylase (carboxylating)
MSQTQTATLPALEQRLRWALQEDLDRAGDVTSLALVPPGRFARGIVLVKEPGVLCGVDLLASIFRMVSEELSRRGRPRISFSRKALRVTIHCRDGAKVKAGDVVARLYGPARVLLAGERTALNLLCHLSGVATHAARFADAVKGTRARILDTRKTTPLWRDLEKHAVACGGGVNHRRGLYDMTLIKDNHLARWGATDPAAAVREARRRFPKIPVEVEVVDLAGLRQVCRESSPDFVLLDNFAPARVRAAVEWCASYYRRRGRRPLLEASGGITLANVRSYARAGVDRISIGALTHSSRALDLSLEVFSCAEQTAHRRVRA